MLFNYHTHTKRCNHAEGEDREYVEKAIEGGMKTLGFSDHAPYLFPSTEYYSTFRMQTDELFSYVESIRALAKEYASDIHILCGFELEYYPDFHKEEMAFLKQVQPDYILMGQHFIGNELLPARLSKHEDGFLSSYVTQVLAGLATGDFLYLAHPDLAGFQFSEECIKTQYRRLCEGAKRMGIPLEINCLGIRTKRHYPDARLFKIASEVGNEVIIGSDAHAPIDVCDVASEKTAKEMAAACGLKVIDKPII